MNQQFIKQHLGDDVRQLALQAHRYKGIDVSFCLQQISGYQIAKQKLPLWAETEGILYPVHLSMEQCSSQMTAEYKASIIPEGERMIDLTAGFGVDATMLAKKFQHLTYVEQNAELCEIARNNLPLLGIKEYEVKNCMSEELLNEDAHYSLIYLDPARRDSNGNKVFGISDCTPDVSILQDTLLTMADLVMIKLSPMLDLKNIATQLRHVKEIHVVSVNGECKEMLVLLSQEHTSEPQISCVNLKANGTTEDVVAFMPSEEQNANATFATPQPFNYLYEPNASIMKGGCYRFLSEKYGISQIHPSSHLYISDTLVEHFPGRTFAIDSVFSLNKREIKQNLEGVKQANITVRNFPASVADLRKRLKLSDGGQTYLFATTLSDESKVIIKTKKL